MSRKLKRGEFKKILIDEFEKGNIDFLFDSYKSGRYYFIRKRQLNSFEYIEGISISFGLNDGNFDASYTSYLDHSQYRSSRYAAGFINFNSSILYDKHNTSVMFLGGGYYYHNGIYEDTVKVVKELVEDIKNVCIPKLEELNRWRDKYNIPEKIMKVVKKYNKKQISYFTDIEDAITDCIMKKMDKVPSDEYYKFVKILEKTFKDVDTSRFGIKDDHLYNYYMMSIVSSFITYIINDRGKR